MKYFLITLLSLLFKSLSKELKIMSRIGESELIINADGSIFHLHLKPENIADNIILVGDQDRVEMVSKYFDNVELILRRGDIIPELRTEVEAHNYDVTIIGGSHKRRMAHDLVQYIDSSIFVVNQFDNSKKYKLLLAVDDSMGTSNAVSYGVRVAKAFKMPVDVLTVSKREHFGKGYQDAHKSALKVLERESIKATSHLIVGDPVKTIKDTAGDDHIIVMGVSHKNPIAKFIFASKPLKVMEESECPVLIVK